MIKTEVGRYRHSDMEASIFRVTTAQPFRWLALGWDDLWANPRASLSHSGLLLGIAAVVLVTMGTHIHLFAAMVAGFLALGPIAAAAFYALSRTRQAGVAGTFESALIESVRRIGALFRLGVVLAILTGLWAWISDDVLRTVFGGQLPPMGSDVWRSVLEWRYPDLVFAYAITGFPVAWLAFAVSAVSAPAIFDGETSVTSAIGTSLRSVVVNPLPMLVWGLLVGGLTLAGCLGGFVGLVVIIPWLGHATWHAYRDIVKNA